jgi:hypothetical protein
MYCNIARVKSQFYVKKHNDVISHERKELWKNFKKIYTKKPFYGMVLSAVIELLRFFKEEIDK